MLKMIKIKYLILLSGILLLFLSCSKNIDKNLEPGIYAVMKTNKGSFIIRLEYEKVPMLVVNFIGLTEGIFIKYDNNALRLYDGTSFHEVTEGILIKGGIPAVKGRDGPGYNLPENFHPDLKHDRAGVISMARIESSIHGSQFSISLINTPWLDYRQPVFGYVVEGINILKTIKAGDVLKKVTILKIGDKASQFNVTREYLNILKKQVEYENREETDKRDKEVAGLLKEKWPGLIRMRNGTMLTILKQGKGTTPSIGTEALIRYKGTLIDGTVFLDSTRDGSDRKVEIGKIIKGLN